MSRWLQNVGNFLDQLDTKAAVVVTSAVSGRDVDFDEDYEDDEHVHRSSINVVDHDDLKTGSSSNNAANLKAQLLYEEHSRDENMVAADDDDDDEYGADDGDATTAAFRHYPNPHYGRPRMKGDDLHHCDEQIDTSGFKNHPQQDPSTTVSPPPPPPKIVVDSSSLSSSDVKTKLEQDGWNDDDLDDVTERSSRSAGVTTTTTTTTSGDQPTDDNIGDIQHTESSDVHVPDTPISLSNKSNPETDTTTNPKPLHANSTSHILSDTTDTEIQGGDETGATGGGNQWVERIAALEQELQQRQIQLHQVQQEKQQEVYVISKEARTLRRHLATINEQLAAADKEVGAQRQELENAAQRFEKDQIKYKQDMQALQAKHSSDLQQIRLSHQETIATLQAQSQNQMDALKTEISDMRRQRQLEGGDWNKELAEATQREQLLAQERQSLIDERETLLGQIDTLRSQQESLGSRLESLTVMADNAAMRERDAELQLDQAMTAHAKQLSQRQAREAELERTVSELSGLLVIERSKHTTLTMGSLDNVPSSRDTVSPESDETMAIEQLDAVQSQVEIERQQNASLKKELDDLVRERQEEALLTQTRQAQHEKKVSELTQQLLELQATIHDVKQQDTTMQQRQTDESIANTQRIQDLSEELVRLRERISVSNSEAAALRNRLQAALNRAIVAEAAAESVFATPTASDLQYTPWSSSSSTNATNDPESGLSVRRRGTNHRTATRQSSSDTAPTTIRNALRLDSVPSNGIGNSNAQSIGKGLDLLDGFLAQSGEILRFNAIARLCFVVYLLLLHFWTFALLIFHAHGLEAIQGNTMGGQGVSAQGPGALMQKAAIVNLPTGN